MDTFPIVKQKDVAAYDTYHTEDTILSIYDEMAEAIRTGEPHRLTVTSGPGPRQTERGTSSLSPNGNPASSNRPTGLPTYIHHERS